MKIQLRKKKKYWVAVGVLMVSSAVGSEAHAQNRNGASPPGQVQPALAVRRFDIASGSLDAVLQAFEAAGEVRVAVPNEGMRNVNSPGVTGVFTVEQALQQLLAGTGITYRFTSATTATLEFQIVASSVDVTANGTVLATSLPKYTEPLRDTPQSISVVSQEVMEEQGATTLRDALRNVAGISLAAGEGSSQGDNLTIRGFTARNDLFVDGMLDFGSYYRDPFNLQEVDVLQGPSLGDLRPRVHRRGCRNQAASKTPVMGAFISGGFDFGTDLTRRLTIDIDKPLPALGPGSAFRLNVMGDEGNVAGCDVTENRRFGIAPSLALGLGTATRATFSYFHQDADDIPDYGVPWLFNGAAPVPRENYYGFKNGNFLRTYDDIGTIKLEHDFNSKVTVRDQVRYANYVRDVLITEPQILTPSLSTPLSDLIVNRNELAANSTETYLDEQLDVTARLGTGFVKQTVIAGVEAGRETSDPVRPKYINVPTTSLLDPNPDDPFTATATPSSIVHTTSLSVGAYVLDTVKLGQKWDLTGGLRWDRFQTGYTQAVPPASAFNRLDELPTWRGAIVYKPVSIGSIYFDAGTSFNPSAESLSLSAANANLPPEKNKTYEFGTRRDLSHEKLSLRSAIFRTDKTNAREPDPNNPLLNVLAGNQRVDGFEFEVKGRLTSRWEVLSGYAYLDSRVVSSQYYPAAVGAQLANVPRHTFNLWTEYHLPRHWEIGTGGNFVSSRTASSTVPLDPTTGLVKEVPGYWVFNAMAKHPLNEHVSDSSDQREQHRQSLLLRSTPSGAHRPGCGALGTDRAQVQILKCYSPYPKC